ncbi:Unknown protein, partial [Striga hermonthica]
ERKEAQKEEQKHEKHKIKRNTENKINTKTKYHTCLPRQRRQICCVQIIIIYRAPNRRIRFSGRSRKAVRNLGSILITHKSKENPKHTNLCIWCWFRI